MASGGGTKAIWYAFGILFILTIVEVTLGIIKPSVLINSHFISLSLLNWIFVILTLIKAYYIVWYFMHVKYEVPILKKTLVYPIFVFVAFLIFILLYEADSLFNLIEELLN